MKVSDKMGQQVQLADAPLAQGGEGSVYEVNGHARVVVKIYHPDVLQKNGHALKEKIAAMCEDPVFGPLKAHSRLAWPRMPVFNEQGQWIGFAMQKVGGVRMSVLAHAMAYKEYFPNLSRPRLVGYLTDLIQTLQDLQRVGVLVGDYNLANFLCNPAAATISLIDCDSWQIQSRGRMHYCMVNAPDMFAPELIGAQLNKEVRTESSEAFSLAILIFKTLMLGRHPYDVRGGESPVANLCKGYFPYGTGGGGIPKGHWYNIWSHLPFALKEHMCTTFNQGAKQPGDRTTLQEWRNALQRYAVEMERGWHATVLKPLTPKSSNRLGTGVSAGPGTLLSAPRPQGAQRRYA